MRTFHIGALILVVVIEKTTCVVSQSCDDQPYGALIRNS